MKKALVLFILTSPFIPSTAHAYNALPTKTAKFILKSNVAKKHIRFRKKNNPTKDRIRNS